MLGTTYTLREMAAILAGSGAGEPFERLMRQIRHWTVNDLLKTEGQKHTGTGHSRRYSFEALRKAAVLRELSLYGLTVTQLAGLNPRLDELARKPAWAVASEGEEQVYLVLYIGAEGNSAIKLSRGEADSAALLDPAHGTSDVKAPNEFALMGFRSGLVLNLTQIFRFLPEF